MAGIVNYRQYCIILNDEFGVQTFTVLPLRKYCRWEGE